MDNLQATYSDDHDDVITTTTTTPTTPTVVPPPQQTQETPTLTPDSDSLSDPSPNFTKTISSEDEDIDIDNFVDIDTETEPPPKKLKSIEEVITPLPPKAKKNKNSKKKTKGNNVWTKSTSRKGKKRTKSTTASVAESEDNVLITPIHRLDRNDDSPDMSICLSKVYKAEKVELSEDRMSAGSCKGYRMVRATRGVSDGAWYFEIKIVSLGETGHTRLGWCNEKGDLQAPVGYDGNSYGFRDVDGSKVHKALREKYGDGGYGEGDVIGFYVNLPDGEGYAPKAAQLVLYKGQKYAYANEGKEEAPKVVPGSEICFYKNGICQGSAFKDLNGGRYYPAASMYTLPNQSNCVVKFNFGPDFEAFPEDFGERPIPRPMVEVPYHGFDGSVQNGIPLGSTRMCPMLKVVKEND